VKDGLLFERDSNVANALVLSTERCEVAVGSMEWAALKFETQVSTMQSRIGYGVGMSLKA
jgi:hypothetical protein